MSFLGKYSWRSRYPSSLRCRRPVKGNETVHLSPVNADLTLGLAHVWSIVKLPDGPVLSSPRGLRSVSVGMWRRERRPPDHKRGEGPRNLGVADEDRGADAVEGSSLRSKQQEGES